MLRLMLRYQPVNSAILCCLHGSQPSDWSMLLGACMTPITPHDQNEKLIMSNIDARLY
jgi:hypothetical protein